MSYQATIGLEIHAQLDTTTKMFSSSPNDPGATLPNTIVSPIDAGHPGTLPAINKAAVEHVIRVGLAVGGQIADYTEWDRKNYFYPDIPKAYQISQYKYPLVTGGQIAGFALTRIHLEEDTGKSQHDKGEYSLIDYNRAGMPLMELVTEPVLHSGEDAATFAKELQLILRYLGAGQANLEKGEMRIEANISVSQTNELGTKVEVKNLNSFRSVEQAINYEVKRQIETLESGAEVVQETRGWDENKSQTFSQRAKEDAHDYRYFPDPDIPKLFVAEVFDLVRLKEELPELPLARRQRLQKLGLTPQLIEFFIQSVPYFKLLEETLTIRADKDISVRVANLLASEVAGLESTSPGGKITNVAAVDLVAVAEMLADDELSSRGAKLILAEIYNNSRQNAKKLAVDLNVKQINDPTEIKALANEILAEFPEAVAEFRAGKENAIKFLVGQGMRKSANRINPQKLTEVIQNLLT